MKNNILTLSGHWYITTDIDCGNIYCYLGNDKTEQYCSLEYALDVGEDSSQDLPIPENILALAEQFAKKINY